MLLKLLVFIATLITINEVIILIVKATFLRGFILVNGFIHSEKSYTFFSIDRPQYGIHFPRLPQNMQNNFSVFVNGFVILVCSI